jgi:hypothetical protein
MKLRHQPYSPKWEQEEEKEEPLLATAISSGSETQVSHPHKI